MGSYNFSIDGHIMEVIEADGLVTEKQTVDILRIGVGQRCDLRILIFRFCSSQGSINAQY